MKKKTLVVVIAVGALVLATVFGAAMVGAQDGGKRSGILGRAAEILGIEQADLEDALEQAKSEAADAKMAEFLASSVTAGKITQAEADAISDWLAARPELSDDAGRKAGRLIGPFGGSFSAEKLDWLVTKGLISEDDRTALGNWLDDRPEAAGKLMPEGKDWGRGKGKGHFGKGRGGFGKGGCPGKSGDYDGWKSKAESSKGLGSKT